MTTIPEWKYRDLVSAFGSDQQVANAIHREGFDPPPLKTIQGWRNRNSISAPWAPLFIHMAIKRGIIDNVKSSLLLRKRKQKH